jgi:hypothetical protein
MYFSIFCPMQYFTRFVSIFLFFVLTAPVSVRAQIIYAHNLNFTGTNDLFAIDLSDCSYCPILTNSLPYDQIFLPDQRFLTASDLYDTNMNYLGSAPVPSFSYSYASLNGLIYFASGLSFYGQLYVMNPVTFQVTYLGDFPTLFPLYGGQLYVYNNELYSMALNAPHQIWKVNIANPANSTVWGSLPTNSLSITTIRGTAYANNLVYIADAFPTASTRILRYNPANNELILLCQSSGGYNFTPQVPVFNVKPGYTNNLGVLSGLTVSPPGVTLPCICLTNAGLMAYSLPIKVCVPEPVQFSPAIGTNVQPDDILQYIMCTNPAVPLQTIVASSSTPSFSYNPSTMQLGTYYYIFSVAGNNINGAASQQDPCFDISNNYISAIWGNAPQVAFSVPNMNFCQGQCIDLNVSLTGVAPFSLTYNTGGANQVINFTSNTGILTLCPPGNVPLGAFNVQAVRLEDQTCICD